MSADRSHKRVRMPSSKLRDEANDAEPEVMSHRNARNHARPQATATLAPAILTQVAPAATAGADPKRKPRAPAAEPHCQTQVTQTSHYALAATIVPELPAEPASATTGSKWKSNAVDANSDVEVEITEGE